MCGLQFLPLDWLIVINWLCGMWLSASHQTILFALNVRLINLSSLTYIVQANSTFCSVQFTVFFKQEDFLAALLRPHSIVFKNHRAFDPHNNTQYSQNKTVSALSGDPQTCELAPLQLLPVSLSALSTSRSLIWGLATTGLYLCWSTSGMSPTFFNTIVLFGSSGMVGAMLFILFLPLERYLQRHIMRTMNAKKRTLNIMRGT